VGVLAVGAGMGVTTALRGSVPADARIPLPPAKNAVFVADDDDVSLDQQIMQASAAAVVSIRSARGAALGSGFVVTRSGFVLASYQGLPGAGALTARLVMSGRTYPARLVGSDPGANLALLQLSGGTGFAPVAIGTAGDVSLNDQVASAGGNWETRGLVLTPGAISGLDASVSLDGYPLTGLLAVSAVSAPPSELGGPLFNLSGQVLGITVGYGTSRDGGEYAMPIDSALQLARQIAGQ
jgi:S1-C subfamily serine protease